MRRLIDANALDVLTIIGGRMNGKVEIAKAVNEMIQNAPTIDAEPFGMEGLSEQSLMDMQTGIRSITNGSAVNVDAFLKKKNQRTTTARTVGQI